MIDREVARLKFASLRQNATVEDINLRAPRGIERAFFAKLVDGDWIGRKQNSSPGRPASARVGSPARSATRHAAIIDPSYTIACQGCSKPLRWPAATDATRGSSRRCQGSICSSLTIGASRLSPAF